MAGVEELSPILASLSEAGGAAHPADFRPIIATARAVAAVRRALGKTESPHLSERRERLPLLDSLLEDARRLFAPDGSVRDDASPALSQARSRLRRRRGEVSRSLEKILDQRREFLGDAVVVLRNDRYCLPVVSSSRSRVPGIVHDRSGSGQTVFVEPLEVIEANNELALLAAEEHREVERLVTEFGRSVLAASADLTRAVEHLAELDGLEARVDFGELSEGRIPDLSDDGSWSLSGARHPLLDPRLAPLRRRVLSEDRPEREVVPLDLDLPREKRLLVVSGPNAGGKTVVLKTAGLFSLLAQSGIPVPAAAGTRLPIFSAVRTEIGDAQAILSDRSTFSSSMETLAATLKESGPGVLALVDEIGAATDPEEGAAIAIAWLEDYLARGGRAIVTTHLSALKIFAASRTDAVAAAMEFDEGSGRPNYRLHPGLSGRSRALSVARERGLPDSVLERARALLGQAWERRDKLETEAEEALERLRRAEEEAAVLRERAVREGERLAEERKEVASERVRLRQEGLAGFERARKELARRVEKELAQIRQNAARHAEDSAATLVGSAEREVAAEPALAEALRAAEELRGELAPGAGARVRGSHMAGLVASIDGESAWLDVSGKRVQVPISQLEPAASPARSAAGRAKTSSHARPEPVATLTREVNVIGRRLEEAIEEIERRLDQALVEGAGRLRVVHGHGTGRLRKGVREHFTKYPGVARLHAADAREGGNGATILELT